MKKRKAMHRGISLILMILLIISLMPVGTAFAETTTDSYVTEADEHFLNNTLVDDNNVNESVDSADETWSPAFFESMDVDNVTITVNAPEGVFPTDAVLSAEAVSSEEQQVVEEIVGDAREDGQRVAKSYTFDIKVLDADGNELQPEEGDQVTVSFAAAETADENLEAQIYHITEDEVAEPLVTETTEEEVVAQTDGFSYYTVEFTYNELQYVMQGDTTIDLDEILDTIGLAGEVQDVECSNPELFSASCQDGIWIVTAHQAFLSEEWMKVTINDVVYEIVVTDKQYDYTWFNNKLAELKKAYPHGSRFNENVGGIQCWAYANRMAERVFGSWWTTWGSHQNRASIFPGDVIRLSFGHGGHSIFVTAVNGNTIQYTDCNYDFKNGVRWGATINRNSISFSGADRAGIYHAPNYDAVIKEYKPAPTHVHTRGSIMSKGAGRVVPDGDYLIVRSYSTNSRDKKYLNLDIQGMELPAKNSTNVFVWNEGNAENIAACNAWTLKYNNNGFYTITQKGTNMALDVNGASLECHANVQVYQKNTSNAQKWSIEEEWVGGACVGYHLRAKCSGYVLDINGGGTADRTNVHMWPYSNGNKGQIWSLIPYKPAQPIADGRYILVSAIDPTVTLDISGDTANVANNANVQVWHDSADSRYNSFDVRKLPNGYYSIRQAASGMSLDVSDGFSSEGIRATANIQMFSPHGGLNQQWAITPQNDGYMIRSACSGFVMDVADGKTANGTNVRQLRYNGSKAQTWKFVPAEYTVTYNANGGSGAPARQTKYYRKNLTLQSGKPSRKGYVFKGWSKSANSKTASYAPGAQYTLDYNLALYAVWEKAPTATNRASGGKKETVTFTDVPRSGKYYSAPVYWAVEKGITYGYTDSTGKKHTFKPQNDCTRAEMVTFLWRLAGSPKPKTAKNPFKDVRNKDYFYKAVLWAAEKGIAKGYKDGNFRPNETCKREHAVTFLWRYAGKPAVSSTKGFKDVKKKDYYHKAVLWAVNKGITKGYSDGTFKPKSNCLREHIVTFMYRYKK